MNADNVAKLFNRFYKPVRSWLSHQGTFDSDVDDLAMEVFCRLLRYESHEVVANPGGYVFRIASNVASEWRARCRVKYPHDDTWLEDLLAPETSWEEEEMTEYLDHVTGLLPERQRKILFMHVYEGRTYKQIAVELGLTYRVVLRELTKAYSFLRNTVATEGVFSEHAKGSGVIVVKGRRIRLQTGDRSSRVRQRPKQSA